MKLRVSELFYSLQGEGSRKGQPSVFIRLQGCSAKHACFASRVVCDTEFESGRSWDVEELIAYIKSKWGADVKWVVFTGGEPLDQLTCEVLGRFRLNDYKVQIETSGVVPLEKDLPYFIDLLTISPKVAEHVLLKHFSFYTEENIGGIEGFDMELKYVRHEGQSIPAPSLKAKHYFISPHFDGWNANDANIQHCIQLVKDNPQWQLSIQEHKLIIIL